MNEVSCVPTVVVDANAIVHRDWRLQSPWWRLLLELSAIERIELVVPEIVVREVVGKYARAAKALSKDLRNLQMPFDLDESVASYESQLRKRLKEAKSQTLETDSVEILELVDRAVARRRPFDDEGNGFRDTVIWMQVLNLVSTDARVHFISSDSAFYAGKGTERHLKQELAEEAEAAGGSVSWFYELGDLLASIGKGPTDEKDRVAEADVLQILREDSELLLNGLHDAATQSRLIVDDEETGASRIGEFLPPMRVLDVSVRQYPDSGDANEFYVSIQFGGGIRIETVRHKHQSFESAEVVELDHMVFWVSADYSNGKLSDFELDPIQLSSADHLRSKISKQLNEELMARFAIENPFADISKQLNEDLMARLEEE